MDPWFTLEMLESWFSSALSYSESSSSRSKIVSLSFKKKTATINNHKKCVSPYNLQATTNIMQLMFGNTSGHISGCWVNKRTQPSEYSALFAVRCDAVVPHLPQFVLQQYFANIFMRRRFLCYNMATNSTQVAICASLVSNCVAFWYLILDNS